MVWASQLSFIRSLFYPPGNWAFELPKRTDPNEAWGVSMVWPILGPKR